jgi:Protein of unknown function (DUF4239)
MLSYFESGFAIALSLVAAMLLVAVLNRVWSVHSRKMINDVNAWQLGVLGTTYGVILGFMLYTVWGQFRGAEMDASLEATSALNVYRIAVGLPEPQRDQMQELAKQYVDAVANQEWPAMQHQQERHAGGVVLAQMWKVLSSVKAESNGETNSVDHISSAMSNLAERRNLREDQKTSELPVLMWVLLIVGGIATVGSSCLLGNDNKWLHYCQVLALTFVVAVTLAAIADLAKPYEGAVAVKATVFVRTLEVMQGSAIP